MKKSGYEYAIIGQAGPIEFYERSCNATFNTHREIINQLPIGELVSLRKLQE